MSTENALLTILAEKINNDTLTLPTLPEVAVKIRRAADDPNIDLHKMADVIGHDPALSARMIKVANSSLLAGKVKVESLNQAVTRIGLRQVKNIATAMAMEQLFVSKNALIKNYMMRSWQKTVEVSIIAMTLMQVYLRKNRHGALSLDTITLAALVHNIGVLPILTEAERHEDVFANPTFLVQAIQKLSGRIGASIMKAWGFSAEFVDVADKWNRLEFSSEKPSYIDFIRLAALHTGALRVDNKAELLQQYVEKQILPAIDYLDSADFHERLDEMKEVFN